MDKETFEYVQFLKDIWCPSCKAMFAATGKISRVLNQNGKPITAKLDNRFPSRIYGECVDCKQQVIVEYPHILPLTNGNHSLVSVGDVYVFDIEWNGVGNTP